MGLETELWKPAFLVKNVTTLVLQRRILPFLHLRHIGQLYDTFSSKKKTPLRARRPPSPAPLLRHRGYEFWAVGAIFPEPGELK